MNDRIMVGFRNDKALKCESVVSERDFPVVDISYDDRHTYAVLNIEKEEVFDKYILALTEYITKRYEPKLLRRIILEKYPDIPRMTVNEIIKQNDNDDLKACRKVLEDILYRYFSENKSGNVEGIVTFRLREYKKLLNQVAENMVDAHYLNREYDDFIDLLRYFISVQDLRIDLIYIVVNQCGMYTILDKNKNDITRKAVSEIVSVSDAGELAYDDLLISVLISLAPVEIIIENKENIKNPQFFETIEKVFERVEYR